MDKNQKYPASMRLMHWLMAIMIIGQIFLGWWMTPYDEANGPLLSQMYWWHKSFGLLVFLLVFVRLTNRLRLRRRLPVLPATLPARERTLAHLAHSALYFLIIMVPITGYTLSSAFEFSDGVTFFGIAVPELIPHSKPVFEAADLLHAVLAYTLLAVIVLHVAGALKHRYLDRNPEHDVLPRIL